jgi:hypothetical protein
MLKEKWLEKKNQMLADKINVTEFFVKLFDQYPESLKLYKKVLR